jgi:N-methylhydantoinase B
VTPEAAARDYGVVVRFTGDPDALVRLPEEWVVDEAATRALRERRRTERAR